MLFESKYILGPMVRGSELAFRKLCVEKGNILTVFTPMMSIVNGEFNEDLIDLESGEMHHHNIIAQVAGRDKHSLLTACLKIVKKVHAIDLNLGCPQSCALSGQYGAFLLQEPELVSEIVQHLSSHLDIPFSCKIRLLDGPVENTIRFAKMLEDSGCSFITIHGRRREDKHFGKVDYAAIAKIKSILKIPVLCNGGIYSKSQGDEILKATGTDGVVLASGLLKNHRIISEPDTTHNIVDLALEYLDYAEKYPTTSPLVLKVHLKHILRTFLKSDPSYIRWWSALQQNWLVTPHQHRSLLVLMATQLSLPFDEEALDSVNIPLLTSFAELKRGREII